MKGYLGSGRGGEGGRGREGGREGDSNTNAPSRKSTRHFAENSGVNERYRVRDAGMEGTGLTGGIRRLILHSMPWHGTGRLEQLVKKEAMFKSKKYTTDAIIQVPLPTSNNPPASTLVK